MATTDLAEQLKRLRTPQTTLLLQDTRKPSLLFDVKEAANLDRDTVYNIGLSGLEELTKLCGKFDEFKKTLFAPSSISLERSVQDNKVNKNLDSEIDKFLVLLSPYFLLNISHKALEWLIHRFHIHQFNKDNYLLLILPYHETKIFVRALQLLDLSDPADKWHWLKPIQKTRTPLPPLTLVNRVAHDNGFLKLICAHVIFATKIYGDRANSLNTLYAFFTTALVGTVESSASITDVQFNHMLPVLLKGLPSQIPDFASSSYVIFAKLITRIKIQDETMDKLVLKSIKKPISTQEVMALILFLYDNPFNSLSVVSESLMLKFSNRPWFVDTMIKVKSHGVNISKFVILLLESAFSYISKNAGSSESEDVKEMLEDIFNRIPLEEDEVRLILEKTLANDAVSGENSDITKEYLGSLYQSIERKYPDSFDRYLHELMHLKEANEHTNKILKFLMSWYSKAEECLDIFTGLNHNNPEQRIIAIQMIGKNLTIPDNLRELVNKSLLTRFNDDDDRVIMALLNLPINLLQNTFAVDTLVDELIILVSRCHTGEKRMLAKPALKVLLELCDETDDTSVFLVIVPYLFPTADEDVDIAIQILTSGFARRNAFLKKIAQEIGNETNAEFIRMAAFHIIMTPEVLPPAINILTAIKQQMTHGDAASVFFNLVVLGSVCRVPVGSLQLDIARQVIETASEMVNNFPKVLPLTGANHLNADNFLDALKYVSQGYLPLQANTYVLEMVHRRLQLNITSKFNFEEDPERSELMLRLLEIIFDGIVLEQWRSNYSQWELHHQWYLKIFFKRHFKNEEEVIRFLSQLYIKPVKPQTSLHCLEISLLLLDKCNSFQWAFNDRDFVINLLLALSSENNVCREAAVNILKKLSQTFNISMEGFSALLSELMDRNTEISLDHDQLSLSLYTLLSPDPDVTYQLKAELRVKLEKTRDLLFEAVLSNEVPIHVRSQLLDILIHVNGPKILKKLIPLGTELLNKIDERDTFAQNALKNIIQRFDNSSVAAVKDKHVWSFFINCLSTHNKYISTESGKQFINVILLKQIDNNFFVSLGEISQNLQKEFLAKLVDIVTDCEIDSILSTTTRVVKKLHIDAQLVVDELKMMTDLEEETSESNRNRASLRKKRSISRISNRYNPEIVHSRKWKRGITLLEFLQHSNNIENEQLLVPVLFDLLKTSLCFEEQSPVEYTNQLVLSTIHHLITKSIPVKDADAYVDLISQCIRTSHNPQTHHHALLVLVELFKLADIQRALQNIMPIFTFMGNTVLRQDDAYSIQIISKTIDTVVPIINAANNVNHVCEILRLFITSLPDIPEHRRVPLFVKLLQLLDNHLHLYYLLTFESHVLSKNVEPSSSSELSSERLRFALSISNKFPVKKVIEVCVKFVEFLKELPVDIDENQKHNIKFKSNHIFDVANNSPKQLRHYKFTIVRFLVSLLSGSDFINRVAELDEDDVEILRPIYDQLIVELVIYIQNTSRNADLHQGKPNGKYWKVMLHGLYDILDLVNNLLPNQIFIASAARLIDHDSLTVRRKALELLNARLAQKKFTDEDHEDLLGLIEPITSVLSGPHKFVNPEVEVIQQTALITLKLLAKVLASKRPDVFKPILDLATELVKKREGAVLGSAALCVAELCSSMRVHAIQSLNKFVPAIIRLLEKHCHQEIPDILTISIVSALQKIVESVGNFLSLYLDQLLYELSRLNFLYTDSEHPKIGLVVSRLKATTQKLSSCIPLRVLLPAINKTYDTLLTNKSYQCIPPLMNIIAESFGSVQSSALSSAIPDLATFFLKVLQFREEVTVSKGEMEVDGEATLNDVTNVEESASKALVALVLKLSEATFRPLYYRLYDWAARNPQHKQRNITFYRLSANIAECLKSLFVLFAGHFLKHAASLLTGNNMINANEETLEITLEDEASKIELIEEILLTLLRVFTYDAHDFVNQERFETLMQPIVDQLENTIGTKVEYEKRAKNFIVPCIASFAGAIPDDSLHKQLVYQVLLKTRHTKPYVRNAALDSLVEIARKLGEDFMPLLPETVPFLAELLEDEDLVTEKNAQNAVRTLEDILGEPLQKYF
ncbi:hypothetical protein TSAR_002629 [Trichomalopsis sarcophagae]|uniref:HEAT repeat-containing protein 1 n=1 Tax=Trichomalopsis sarcophagae TaxID=543379 RepID=A0A232FBX1_9HYME|nr:hypothetical protein TSAR_002629 [Trichomalopsis sarcophagae]